MAKSDPVVALITSKSVLKRAEQGARAAGLPRQALKDFVEGLPGILWEGFSKSFDPSRGMSPESFARMWAKSRALDVRRALESRPQGGEYDTTLDGVPTIAKSGDTVVKGIASEGSPDDNLIAADLATLESEALTEGGFSLRDVSIYEALKGDDSIEAAEAVARQTGLTVAGVRTVLCRVRAYVRAYVLAWG